MLGFERLFGSASEPGPKTNRSRAATTIAASGRFFHMLTTEQAAVLAYLMRQPRRQASAPQIAEMLDRQGRLDGRSRLLKGMNEDLELCKIVGLRGRGFRLEVFE